MGFDPLSIFRVDLAEDLGECKDTCRNNTRCAWFTFDGREKFCILSEDCNDGPGNC